MTQRLAKLFFNKSLLLALGSAAVVIFLLGGSFLSLVHNKLELRKLTRQSAALDKEYEKLCADE